MITSLAEVPQQADKNKNLKYNALLLKSLLEKLEGAIFNINFHGIITSVSEEFTVLVGRPGNHSFFIGQHLASFMEGRNVAARIQRKILSLSKETAISSYQHSCCWKDNDCEIELVLEFFRPSPEETEINVFVKKLKKGESPSSAKQKNLEQIIDNLGAVIWLCSQDTSHIYYVNSCFEKYYEMTFEDFRKDPDLLHNRIHPDDLNGVMAAYDASQGPTVWKYEFRYLLNNGTWRYISSYRYPIYDKNNNLIQLAGISIDVTQYRKEQEQILSKFNKSNEELKKANRLLEDFTAFSCHNLKNPLRAINIYTEILQTNYFQHIDENGKKVFSTIQAAIHRMKEIIEGIGKLFLISHDSKEIPNLDISRLIEQNIELLYSPAVKPMCSIEKGTLHSIPIKQEHMALILENLIENSIKYNNNFPYIKIRSKEFKNHITYSIQDNGIGIPKEMGEQVFQLGKRLYIKPDQPGAGIGLPTCKKIMSLYGGMIWIHSAPRKGATFYLLFPKRL